MIKNLTKLEEEKQSKKNALEFTEELDQLGQDSETKAAPLIMQKEREREEEEKKQTDTILDNLDFKKKQVYTYKELLIMELARRISDYEIPTGFKYRVVPSDIGIVLYIRSPKGDYFGRGMKVSLDPVLDIKTADRLIMRALDFMESYEKASIQI